MAEVPMSCDSEDDAFTSLEQDPFQQRKVVNRLG
jgi:hypothetical protein